jgi:hypothetical protein
MLITLLKSGNNIFKKQYIEKYDIFYSRKIFAVEKGEKSGCHIILLLLIYITTSTIPF